MAVKVAIVISIPILFVVAEWIITYFVTRSRNYLTRLKYQKQFREMKKKLSRQVVHPKFAERSAKYRREIAPDETLQACDCKYFTIDQSTASWQCTDETGEINGSREDCTVQSTPDCNLLPYCTHRARTQQCESPWPPDPFSLTVQGNAVQTTEPTDMHLRDKIAKNTELNEHDIAVQNQFYVGQCVPFKFSPCLSSHYGKGCRHPFGFTQQGSCELEVQKPIHDHGLILYLKRSADSDKIYSNWSAKYGAQIADKGSQYTPYTDPGLCFDDEYTVQLNQTPADCKDNSNFNWVGGLTYFKHCGEITTAVPSGIAPNVCEIAGCKWLQQIRV